MRARPFALLAAVAVVLAARPAHAGLVLAIEPPASFVPGQTFTFDVSLTNTGPGTVPLQEYGFQVRIESDAGVPPGPGTYDLVPPPGGFPSVDPPADPSYVFADAPPGMTAFFANAGAPPLALDVSDIRLDMPSDLQPNTRYLLYRATVSTDPSLTGGLRFTFDADTLSLGADLMNGVTGLPALMNDPTFQLEPDEPGPILSNAAVPEPGTVVVFVGLAGAALFRRYRQNVE